MKESAAVFSKKPQKKYTREIRRQHIESWRQSGSSMSEYCQHHDVGLSTLNSWVQKQKSSTGLKLNPVKIPAISVLTTSPLVPLEIRLPGGIQIRLSNAKDMATFKNILEVIKACN